MVKLNILHVITNLKTGGAEKLLVDTLPKYINSGVNVDLLLLNNEDTDFKKELINRGVNVFSLGKGSVYNPINILKLLPYLKKYEIIHVHLFPTLYWVALAKKISFSKVILIFTEHSTFNSRLDKPFWTFFDQKIYKSYSKIVSISEDVQHIIQKQLKYRDPSKFVVIQNGINISVFAKYLNSSDTEKIKKTIIQVSSFNIQKDQATLIRALAILPMPIELLLVGDGVNRSKCEDLVSRLKLEDRVKFLGIRNDIPELLANSDIVVQSSFNEGFGLAALEGMATGKPVVASDVSGLNTVVGGAGLLFEVGNEKELAKIIQELFSDNAFYDKVAEACFRRSKEYDINNMVNKYIDLYKDVINDGKE